MSKLGPANRRPIRPATEAAAGNADNKDASIVARVRSGEREAYGELVEKYQDRLFNVLLRVVGSREDAADLVQDALVQAYVKLDAFRGDSQFYTWLYRIAMNLALTHRRRRKPTLSVEASREQVGVEPADAAPTPEENLLSNEQIKQVHAALGELDDEHCQILVLRELEGFSYEQIAEILAMPVGTVRSRLFRARIQLKEKLTILLRS